MVRPEKNAYADAISLHPGTARVALMSQRSVVVVANSRCATVEQNRMEQSFEWDFFTSPRSKVPAAGFSCEPVKPQSDLLLLQRTSLCPSSHLPNMRHSTVLVSKQGGDGQDPSPA